MKVADNSVNMSAFVLKHSRGLVGKIALAVVGSLIATEIQAVVIMGNSTPINDSVPIIEPRARATGFTMPGQDYILTDVVLRLENYDGPTDAIISIYSDSSGLPGSSLATLIDPAGGGAPALDYTFLPAGPTTLFANTSYWLVVAPESGGNYDWTKASDDPSGVGTFDEYAFYSGVVWLGLDPGNLRFTINGEQVTPSVPDTGSTVILLGLGLLTFVFVSQRRWPIARSAEEKNRTF